MIREGTECDEGLILASGFECKYCPPIWQTVLSLLFGFLIFVLFLLYKIKDTKDNAGYDSEDVFLKIVVSSFQLNGLALAYSFDWDSMMSEYLSTQSSATSLGSEYLEFQCMRSEPGNGFLLENIIFLFGPLSLGLLVYLFCLIFRMIKYSKSGRARERDSSPWSEAHRKSYNTALGCSVVILFLLQPNLVERCALVFSCTKMGNGDLLFMTEDLTVQCWTSQHWVYIGTFGLSFAGLYVIGIPVALYKLLSSETNLPMVHQIIDSSLSDDGKSVKEEVHRHDIFRHVSNHPQASLSEKDKARAEKILSNFYSNFSFLFLGYRQEVFFWELVVLMRKAAISLIGVTLSTDQRVSSYIDIRNNAKEGTIPIFV